MGRCVSKQHKLDDDSYDELQRHDGPTGDRQSKLSQLSLRMFCSYAFDKAMYASGEYLCTEPVLAYHGKAKMICACIVSDKSVGKCHKCFRKAQRLQHAMPEVDFSEFQARISRLSGTSSVPDFAVNTTAFFGNWNLVDAVGDGWCLWYSLLRIVANNSPGIEQLNVTVQRCEQSQGRIGVVVFAAALITAVVRAFLQKCPSISFVVKDSFIECFIVLMKEIKSKESWAVFVLRVNDKIEEYFNNYWYYLDTFEAIDVEQFDMGSIFQDSGSVEEVPPTNKVDLIKMIKKTFMRKATQDSGKLDMFSETEWAGYFADIAQRNVIVVRDSPRNPQKDFIVIASVASNVATTEPPVGLYHYNTRNLAASDQTQKNPHRRVLSEFYEGERPLWHFCVMEYSLSLIHI